MSDSPKLVAVVSNHLCVVIEVPALCYEDVFNMLAICRKADGSVLEFPLQLHEDKDCLCYSPSPGVWLESQVPAYFLRPIAKKPSGRAVLKKPVAAKLDQENGDHEEEEEEPENDDEDEEQEGGNGNKEGDGEEPGDDGCGLSKGDGEEQGDDGCGLIKGDGEEQGDDGCGLSKGDGEEQGDDGCGLSKKPCGARRVVGKRPHHQLAEALCIFCLIKLTSYHQCWVIHLRATF